MGLARIASGAEDMASLAQAILSLASYFVTSPLLFEKRQLRNMRRAVGFRQELSDLLCV